MGSEPIWRLLLCLAISGAAGTDPPTTAPTAERRWQPTDIVLDCFLVTENRHQGAFASSGDRERALLVLKQVPVQDDGSLEGITDFEGSTETKHDSPVIFEASVDLVQIPQAEALLHADCSGKAVTCEISQYFFKARQEATLEKAHWFISNMQVSRGGPGVSMVMKTLGDAETGAVWHPTLNLPLSPQGTVKTEAPPKVQLNLENKDKLPSLICNIAGYYPLDVAVTWIREELGGIPAQVSGASFSNIRKSMTGTYSISSMVTAEPGPTGATYICQVTHVSLEEPLTVSMRVLPNTEQSGAFGVIFASIVFLSALLFLGLHRQQASSSRSIRTMRHSG
ncbi:tapasin-related protein isoform X2 [Arvicanthis niloticus]|uniref:tapasin-related protein isoform X2 n=1 Tax=Arvicanthis niloticus TaxID=61156 RepID=UPI00402B8DAE